MPEKKNQPPVQQTTIGDDNVQIVGNQNVVNQTITQINVIVALATGKTLKEIGSEIAGIVSKARKSPDIVTKILHYLEAIQASVQTLGLERQYILSGARQCNIEEKEQVKALWTKLDLYLHEDNIRRPLSDALRGLDKCSQDIQKEAEAAWWRKQDKEAAVQAFTETSRKLWSALRNLSNNFYPGGSGMGIQTLLPIYQFLDAIKNGQDVEADKGKLRELALIALSDPSHLEWMNTTGQIEFLIAELQLAFSVRTK